jgi:pyruvate/2-oxoglutarate dehydrogenase complex dihydrolipoamide dehydrogenase (E3) component
VVVAGAGLTGSETALYLAQQGKKVTLIDMLSLEQIDENSPFADTRTLRSMLKKLNVEIITEVKLEAITDTGANVTDKKGNRTEISCDTVVLALGVEPRTKAVSMVKDLAPDVLVIGDCNNQRGNLLSATSEGFLTAIEI